LTIGSVTLFKAQERAATIRYAFITFVTTYVVNRVATLGVWLGYAHAPQAGNIQRYKAFAASVVDTLLRAKRSTAFAFHTIGVPVIIDFRAFCRISPRTKTTAAVWGKTKTFQSNTALIGAGIYVTGKRTGITWPSRSNTTIFSSKAVKNGSIILAAVTSAARNIGRAGAHLGTIGLTTSTQAHRPFCWAIFFSVRARRSGTVVHTLFVHAVTRVATTPTGLTAKWIQPTILIGAIRNTRPTCPILTWMPWFTTTATGFTDRVRSALATKTIWLTNLALTDLWVTNHPIGTGIGTLDSTAIVPAAPILAIHKRFTTNAFVLCKIAIIIFGAVGTRLAFGNRFAAVALANDKCQERRQREKAVSELGHAIAMGVIIAPINKK